MRRRWTAVAISVVALLVAGLLVWRPTPPSTAPSPPPWVMGYYVGYQRDLYPLDAVDWESMTHVVVGAAMPRDDGSLDTSFFLDETQGPIWARQVVGRAHQHGRRAVLMLGGARSRPAFSSAASAARRDRLVEQILTVVDGYGFDGVDVDWEPLEAADRADLLALARHLRRERPALELSLPISPISVNDPAPSVLSLMPDAAHVFDRINVMSYGMSAGWDGWDSWHSSPLFGQGPRTPMSIDSSVRALLGAGVPAGRLGLGVGAFGGCMRGVTGPKQSAAAMRTLGDDNTMTYSTIMTRYHDPGRARWDDAAKVPYLTSGRPFGPAGCTFVTYEDPRSIAEKGRYARALGLGGAIVWTIGGGHLPSAPPGRRDPLLEATRRGFLP
ncbi:glycosyl hydrolase family 18 protein [Agilicoccus flavus]|uniref:glycosyl hydrolase family 18 protein n=1 Tax=Agilicoccus flavus TaxID=2775968 RepID=UPI001CF6ADF6|nr:glycoside hydrolase family 18 protein [Agilicoccus flavus]